MGVMKVKKNFMSVLHIYSNVFMLHLRKFTLHKPCTFMIHYALLRLIPKPPLKIEIPQHPINTGIAGFPQRRDDKI